MAWVVFWVYLLCLSICINSEVVPPKPAHVMVGQEATFSCAGEAVAIVWFINSHYIDDLGINDVATEVEGFRTSNITVSDVVQYHNASIECVLLNATFLANNLPPVPLTVFGIGPVPMLYLMPVYPPCVKWDNPEFISDDVTDLMYSVVLHGMGLSSLNTTTNGTQYCLELTSSCQEYTVTVTPFSASTGYSGNSTAFTNTTEGDYSRFEGPCLAEIKFEDADSVSSSFICPLMNAEISCPFQYVNVSTALCSGNESETCLQSSSVQVHVNGTQSSVIINTTGLCPREQYCAEFSILNLSDAVVDMGNTLTFSTFSVQHANISHLINSDEVEVTCFFAINAPASGCLAWFENSSIGQGFNGSAVRTSDSLSSFVMVDIPQAVLYHGALQGLSDIVFDVKIFDIDMDGGIVNRPAFVQVEVLRVEIDDIIVEPTSVAVTISVEGMSTPASPSVTPPSDQNGNVWGYGRLIQTCTGAIVIGSVVAGLAVTIAVAIVVTIAVIIYMRSKGKKYLVPEHASRFLQQSTTTMETFQKVDEDKKGEGETVSGAMFGKSQFREEGTCYDQDPHLINEWPKREKEGLENDLAIATKELESTASELMNTRKVLSTTQQELLTANKLISAIKVELEQKKELLSHATQREKELTASDAENEYTDIIMATIAKIEQYESAVHEKQEQLATLKEERASSLKMAEDGKTKPAQT